MRNLQRMMLRGALLLALSFFVGNRDLLAQIITTASPLPDGVVNVAYPQQQLMASGIGGGQRTWSIVAGSGALPAGLMLNSTSGVISGTPTTAGTASFMVRVVTSTAMAQKNFTLRINTLLTITTASLPQATRNRAYSPQALAASGGVTSYTWSRTSGSLPSGLNLSSNGAITGTPTATGSFTFTVRVVDSSSPQQEATKEFTIEVVALTITTTSPLPVGMSGRPYSQTLTAVNGITPYTWSITGSLPAGLTRTGATISGTPNGTPGTSTFTVQVADGGTPAITDSKSFSLQILPALTITTGSPLSSGILGNQYAQAFAASGGTGPYSFSLVSGTLPAGLNLSGAAVSGTLTNVGTFNFTIRVTDSNTPPFTTDKEFTMDVVFPPGLILSISTVSPLPSGNQGTAYSQTLTQAGGVGPYTWSLVSGSLPAGLNLMGATIAGTPTAAGTSNFTIGVMDSGTVQQSFQKAFALTIGPPLSLSLSGLQTRTLPMQQVPLVLTLPAAQATEVRGTLNLEFSSTAAIPVDDPAVQFSTGGRSVNFTVPPNTTTAVFPSALRVVTGTVAGSISITGSIQNGPSGLALSQTSVDATPPQTTSVVATRINGGLSVRVIGFSPHRSVGEVNFAFDVRVEGGMQTVNLGRPVSSEFTTWYQNPASSAFGSAFRFDQTFGVEGDTSVIEGVTITLRNAQGATTSTRAAFTAN